MMLSVFFFCVCARQERSMMYFPCPGRFRSLAIVSEA